MLSEWPDAIFISSGDFSSTLQIQLLARLPAWWLNPKWSRLCLALLKSWRGNWRQRGYKGLREKREFQTLLGNYLSLPWGSAAKESTCYTGDLGSVSGLGRSPGEGKGYPLQYSGLENSMGSQRVRHEWVTFTSRKSSRENKWKKWSLADSENVFSKGGLENDRESPQGWPSPGSLRGIAPPSSQGRGPKGRPDGDAKWQEAGRAHALSSHVIFQPSRIFSVLPAPFSSFVY